MSYARLSQPVCKTNGRKPKFVVRLTYNQEPSWQPDMESTFWVETLFWLECEPSMLLFYFSSAKPNLYIRSITFSL